MKILGLSDWRGSHDSSASIICDGNLVAIAEEERFSRQKHDGSVPLEAVDYCLRQAGISLQDIDFIAFAGLPFRTGANSFLAELDRQFVLAAVRRGTFRKRTFLHKCLLDACLAMGGGPALNLGLDRYVSSGLHTLEQRFGELPAIRYFGHHASHAAAAYLTSSVESATVVTIDGQGAMYSTVSWKTNGNELVCLRAEPHTNSLGMFYLDCTEFLGLGEYGEGKTMGLAPYGQPESMKGPARRLLDVSNHDWYRYDGPITAQKVGFERRTLEPVLEAPFPNFAAACQSQLEFAVAKVVGSAFQQTDAPDLCLGGGVMLNCSSNGALLAAGRFRSISIFPASGDAGLSTGAALLCAEQVGDLRRQPLPHPYWGPEFANNKCEEALRAEPRLSFSKCQDIAEEVARLLAHGQIVGWFQGRMEIGPRALGNRSILADPRSIVIRDRVNRLKGRELWRPLAPSIAVEASSDYFELNAESPFMLFAARVKPGKRALVPGIVHVDGSARPQTVRREQNPRFYELIRAFERNTGIPVLLNTSFNAAGEPIVCTPGNAIETFLAIGLDVLVLGDFIAKRRAPA